MKRLFSFLAFALLASLLPSSLSARGSEVDIHLTLSRDGSALVRETWSAEINSGTEWYLVRDNLSEMRISDLRVWDEDGNEFTNIGAWDVSASMEEKAAKCGILTKGNGCELCWGLGSYGPRTFTVQYNMSNAVKSLTDYDCLHLQLVSAGIQPRPESVKIKLRGQDIALNEDNAAAWGFGCSAQLFFEDGGLTLVTDEAFYSDEQSVILLLRLDKGLLSPQCASDKSFEEVRLRAFEGSDYQLYLDEQKEEKRTMVQFAILVTISIIFSAILYRRSVKKRNRQIFGVEKLKDIGYQRDLPFGGDILESGYVMKKAFGSLECKDVAAAMILRMLKTGQLTLSYDEKGRALLSFSKDADLSSLSISETSLYQMMRDASGDDLILQSREFSRWSARHQETVMDWAENLESEGYERLENDSYVKELVWTPDGQANARRVIGFKNYLEDFTLLKERASSEVALWQDYIILAALFGIAEQVADELKDINPEAFCQSVGYDYVTMHRLIYISSNMGSNITSAIARQTADSVGGRGGFTSFGGGGGFSGGGFGGGVR